MARSTREPSKNAAPLSKGKKKVPAAANPKPLSLSAAIPEATSTVAKKNKHEMSPIGDGTIKLGEFMPELSCVANEKEDSIQRIDEIKSTDVSRDLEQKEESIQRIDEIKSTEVSRHLEEKVDIKCQITNDQDRERLIAESADGFSKLLKQIPRLSEIEKTVTFVFKIIQDHIPAVKENQSKENSGTSEGSNDLSNKISGVQNHISIVYEETDKVLGTLDDLVQTYKDKSCHVPLNDPRYRLKEIVEKVPQFIDINGHPSRLLSKLMREILLQVFHLHDRGKTHGRLNPKSILICEEGSRMKRQKGLYLCAKLSPHIADSSNTGTDISEWQAPEQRKDPRVRTSSADIYSLGAIFYYCFTGERLSERWETAGNSSFVNFPEANDLLSRSLMKEANLRPKAIELLNHLMFWTSEKKNSFFRDTSERASGKYSNLWSELSVHRVAGGEWDKKIDKENVIRYILEQKRKPEEEKTHEQNKKSKQKKNSDSKQNKKEACIYNFCSVRDLVRVIRNMMVHYGERPEDVQRSIGALHEGFESFFTSRFPNLLIEVYKVVRKFCKEDEYFCRYFSGDACVAD